MKGSRVPPGKFFFSFRLHPPSFFPVRPAAELKSLLFDVHGYLPRWQMETGERATLIHLLNTLRPDCAIEVGTAFGGSLSAIAKFSRRVWTLDKDPACAERLAATFPEVTFLTGKSTHTLPPLVAELSAARAPLGFVLIDGAHTREAVRADLDHLLRFRPVSCPLYVLMHDSFNPDCRAGIEEAAWAENPNVHQVELDFVSGILHETEAKRGEMWGGFALAVLRPEERAGELTITARQGLLFRAAQAASRV